MFLALIAFGVSLIVKLKTKSTKTPWEFFRVLKTYLFLPGRKVLKELNKKRKSQKGDKKSLFLWKKKNPRLVKLPW
jgi:hypothetical protein